MKNSSDLRGITIINHAFLCTAFAVDSTFFLNNLLSVQSLIDTFKAYPLFSGLKANVSKIAGWGFLKGVLEAVCTLKSFNLTTDTIKMVGVHFSYSDTLKVQNNYLDKKYATSASFFEQQNAVVRRKDNYL